MKHNVLSKIADSELQVLKLLWKEKRAMTMTEMRETLTASTGWDGSTVKTLVYRLQDKGAVHAEKQTVFHYTALVSEEEYGQYATSQLIDKLYGGNAKNLVAALVDARRINDDDIAELRDMFKVGESHD